MNAVYVNARLRKNIVPFLICLFGKSEPLRVFVHLITCGGFISHILQLFARSNCGGTYCGCRTCQCFSNTSDNSFYLVELAASAVALLAGIIDFITEIVSLFFGIVKLVCSFV